MVSGEDAALRLDLKGVLYNAQVLPLAGCAMVLHIGGTEAKVRVWLPTFFVRTKDKECWWVLGGGGKMLVG